MNEDEKSLYRVFINFNMFMEYNYSIISHIPYYLFNKLL